MQQRGFDHFSQFFYLLFAASHIGVSDIRFFFNLYSVERKFMIDKLRSRKTRLLHILLKNEISNSMIQNGVHIDL